ncbi:hypothetical protein CJI97_000505 [Candidozyma auris]|nr:hypothetical protein CJI97_000505 [[Candida] auris]
MRLYLSERPRTFIVLDVNYSLILRHPFPTYTNNNRSKKNAIYKHQTKESESEAHSLNKVIVEFVRSSLLDLSSFKDITPNRLKHNKSLLGFLGLLYVKGNIYLGFITNSIRVASVKIDETINLVTDVTFYCLNNDEFDSSINSVEQETNLQKEDPDIHMTNPSHSVQKLLQSGHFYYSSDFDITSNIQERGFSVMSRNRIYADNPYFKSFMWNHFMISELIEFRNGLNPVEKKHFDEAGFLTILSRGYAKTVSITLQGSEEGLLTLISKQSCMKRGPIFGDWGCDDDGFVSNFVETEIVILCERFCFAYVIVRGNVPSFWELESGFRKSSMISKTSKRLVFTRSFETSQLAFNKHFGRLGDQYGDVHVIDCLSGDTKNYRGQLKQRFKEHILTYLEKSSHYKEKPSDDEKDISASHSNYKISSSDLPITTSLMKRAGYTSSNLSELLSPLIDSIVDFGALFYDFNKKVYVGKQLGIFRVNSFDCLGKANFVSKMICQEVIELALRDMNVKVDENIRSVHAKLWKENDDVLKELTQNSLSTSSRTQSEHINKGFKASLTKKYHTVVGDVRSNETAMRKLLGRLHDQETVRLYNPLHQYISCQMMKRASEYSYKRDIKIFATTFNVNGCLCDAKSLKNWFFPPITSKETYDIVFIGFQEIVELTPGKMINSRSENLAEWETKIKKVLEEESFDKSKYITLWSGQMGGIALLLYIKIGQIAQVSNVESAVRKTGFGGMSANKGGMALSLEYSKTKFCFVCSHLAAGMNNLDERHQDYKAIAKGISFTKNRKIRDHDAVIWVGDFNYRITMPNDVVRAMIEKNEISGLFEYDQLNQQMASGETFPFYDEMEICFPPTYKFDNNTSRYDTSDKQRVPAWTDRVLSMSRAKILKQEIYNCCPEVIFSDHRPVFALFRANVIMINESEKKRVSNEIYEGYKKVVGGVNYLLTGSDVSRFVADVGDKIISPPSSDSSKWWLKNGLSARVVLKDLQERDAQCVLVINPYNPSNPWAIRGVETIEGTELVKRLASRP